VTPLDDVSRKFIRLRDNVMHIMFVSKWFTACFYVLFMMVLWMFNVVFFERFRLLGVYN
jgi:hypothetical protein